MILLALTLSLAPAGDGSVWDRLAQCESGGDWDYNGGSGYDGGLQFAPSTWTAMGGPTQYAWQATRTQQIAVAQRLYEVQGWGAWPSCSRQLGLSGNPAQDTAREDAQNDAPELDPDLYPTTTVNAALSVLAEFEAQEAVAPGGGEGGSGDGLGEPSPGPSPDEVSQETEVSPEALPPTE